MLRGKLSSDVRFRQVEVTGGETCGIDLLLAVYLYRRETFSPIATFHIICVAFIHEISNVFMKFRIFLNADLVKKYFLRQHFS